MTKEKRDAIIAEFGEKEGLSIILQTLNMEEHVRRNNIKEHSIDESGFCNIGCC